MSRLAFAFRSFLATASGRRVPSAGRGPAHPASGGKMVDMVKSCGSTLRLRQEMQWEYRFLYVLAFLYFLAVATVTRVLPHAWRPHLPGVEPRQSVFGEARAVAGTLVPFAFTR